MVTTEQLTAFVIVVLAFLNLYNVFASARRNAREEKKRQEAPTETLKSEIIEVNRKLATDKLRLDEHGKAACRPEKRHDGAMRGRAGTA